MDVFSVAPPRKTVARLCAKMGGPSAHYCNITRPPVQEQSQAGSETRPLLVSALEVQPALQEGAVSAWAPSGDDQEGATTSQTHVQKKDPCWAVGFGGESWNVAGRAFLGGAQRACVPASSRHMSSKRLDIIVSLRLSDTTDIYSASSSIPSSLSGTLCSSRSCQQIFSTHGKKRKEATQSKIQARNFNKQFLQASRMKWLRPYGLAPACGPL